MYNARKRGEDRASDYFKRTENVAGVKDMRFQALMPDILHWLGITKIDRMLSMSKYVCPSPSLPFHETLHDRIAPAPSCLLLDRSDLSRQGRTCSGIVDWWPLPPNTHDRRLINDSHHVA